MERRAPKEQPPRKLSGKRTVVGGNSGKQMRRVRPYLTEDVSRRAADRLPVILSGPETEGADAGFAGEWRPRLVRLRSEEHTSELQSLMRISYAVFCLKKKKKNNNDIKNSLHVQIVYYKQKKK